MLCTPEPLVLEDEELVEELDEEEVVVEVLVVVVVLPVPCSANA